MLNFSSNEFWIAVLSGFALFGLDVLALGWGVKRVLYKNGGKSGGFGAALALGGKFLILGLGLYGLILVAKLPIAGIAIGATVCLGVVSVVGRGLMAAK